LGQLYNVLIILVITLLMAVAVTVLAYFVDLVPPLAGNETSMIVGMLVLRGN
jgi:hypothetical protein